jgi:hypothetical protein
VRIYLPSILIDIFIFILFEKALLLFKVSMDLLWERRVNRHAYPVDPDRFWRQPGRPAQVPVSPGTAL